MAGNFKLDVDGDGIALVTWDMPGRSMNVIDMGVITELSAFVEKIATDPGIKGAVITSGKASGFCAGADLTLLEGLGRTFQRLELFGTLSAGENVQVGLESSIKWWQWRHIKRSFPWAKGGGEADGTPTH